MIEYMQILSYPERPLSTPFVDRNDLTANPLSVKILTDHTHSPIPRETVSRQHRRHRRHTPSETVAIKKKRNIL